MDNTSKFYKDHLTVRDKDGKLWHSTPEKIHELEKAGIIKYPEMVPNDESDKRKSPLERWIDVTKKLGIVLNFKESEKNQEDNLPDGSSEE